MRSLGPGAHEPCTSCESSLCLSPARRAHAGQTPPRSVAVVVEVQDREYNQSIGPTQSERPQPRASRRAHHRSATCLPSPCTLWPFMRCTTPREGWVDPNRLNSCTAHATAPKRRRVKQMGWAAYERGVGCLGGGGGPAPCDFPLGCYFFTGPWTVTPSSLRVLRRVAAFCRPLRPVFLMVSFPRWRGSSPPPPPTPVVLNF